jgi:hypothetical protein
MKDTTPIPFAEPSVRPASFCHPGRANRKRRIVYDEIRYRTRHRNAFCRLKDFRRATRHDKFAANFLSAVALATLVEFWQ